MALLTASAYLTRPVRRESSPGGDGVGAESQAMIKPSSSVVDSRVLPSSVASDSCRTGPLLAPIYQTQNHRRVLQNHGDHLLRGSEMKSAKMEALPQQWLLQDGCSRKLK